MWKPRQNLLAEAKSDAGVGPVGQDSAADSTVLFPLCFGLLVRPDGRVLSAAITQSTKHVCLRFVISASPA